MKRSICSIVFLIACGKHSGQPDRLDPAGQHDGSGSAIDISAPAGTAARGGSAVGGASAGDMASNPGASSGNTPGTAPVIDGGTDAGGDAGAIH
jgi:hypothetical protein